MSIRCTIYYGKNEVRHESCVLATVPRVGETIALDIGRRELVVTHITHVVTPKSDTEPEVIVHATKVDHAHRT